MDPQGKRSTVRKEPIQILALKVLTALALASQVLATGPTDDIGGSSRLTANETNAIDESGSRPESLRLKRTITVQTNRLHELASPESPTIKQKSFQWSADWHGWNGLRMEVKQRTLLGDPFEEVRHSVGGTNSIQVFHLEELKLSGKIGAKLAVDAAAFTHGDSLSGFDNGAELRRARVYGRGDCLLVLPVSYELEIGYIPNEFYLEQSYLVFKDIPYIGEFKMGQYQAPMALDVTTSSRDLAFMEPAAPLQALAPGVNAGAQIGRPAFGDRATWRFGVFTDGVGQDFGDASRDYARVISRVTGLVLDQSNSENPPDAQLLHLGLSGNLLYSSSSSVQYRSRPESHLAPYIVDTDTMTADGALTFGAEAAWVRGPFSLQGEYLHSWVKENTGLRPEFDGFYVSASWFLTGETRPYDRREGAFARVLPTKTAAFGRGGWGAWELAGRYSFVNLNSADIQGGRLSMFMFGLNWYLHSHVKWRFDYGLGHVDGREPSGGMHIFQTRIEVDF